jgi:hypothetical protein
MGAQSNQRITWPEGKRFAFTVFDDTDRSTLANVREIYALLRDLGMRTTKSVWPIRGPKTPTIPGDTCDDEAYCKWTRELASEGFEIGYHLATFHGVSREETQEALDRFKELYGHYPHAAANHADNDDAMYWGEARLTGKYQLAYRALHKFSPPRSYGHVENDPRFWGDFCRDRIRYVRNFVFNDIDTLKACPFMPYHDPHRPYVNQWFASSDGALLDSYNQTLSEENQDRLVESGGACIMYTHFGKGFQDGSEVNPRFAQLMTRMAELGGWFVPTSTLLDYIAKQRGEHTITNQERSEMERAWLLERVLTPVKAKLMGL